MLRGENSEKGNERKYKKGCTVILHSHRTVNLHTRDGQSLCVSKRWHTGEVEAQEPTNFV